MDPVPAGGGGGAPLAAAYPGERDSSQCVRVAVNVRPLITSELLIGCADCVTFVPGEPQVQIGAHAFTFDHVYGNGASPSSAVFDDCVAPLVDALFHGYNATVLAYGQTGSGKTYTMGTNYTNGDNNGGIIPQVMDTIFSKIEEMKQQTEFLIRVSFIEIFKEEVFDLLDTNQAALKVDGHSLLKSAGISKVPIQIRETAHGGITLAGVTEPEVRSKEEMAAFLAQGSLHRATGSTNMNSQSSRSHAIFTITMEQKKNNTCLSVGNTKDELGDDILCAKLHLVDLAGSERAKRTGADGLRLKEGIHINRGLLALGNVISALGDDKKRKEGGHVPYRDSKLTRLLQDSLGGNSKTVMIACVSPADTNAEETLNTLKYANRARNIQNKAVVNRDPMAAQVQNMRNIIEQLQSELLYHRGGGAPLEEIQVLRQRILMLEESNSELRQELESIQSNCDHHARRAHDAEVERGKLLLMIESARKAKSWEEFDNKDGIQEHDLLNSYVAKIQDLEAEVLRLRDSSSLAHRRFIDCLDLEDDRFSGKDPFLRAIHELPSVCDGKTIEDSGEAGGTEKELEHSSIQDKLGKELQELDKRLEQKEAEMKRFATADTSVLKQHYEKKLHEMEHEKKALMEEIENLRFNLENMSTASGDGAKKLKEDYLQKLNVLEAQVAELKRKQETQSQLLRQKQKSDEAAKRLQDEIQRIKSQKVQLQHKIKHESEQFRMWKASREKEVLQLKKEGRRNEYEMHKLLALNQRQKMVLQRKTEEASMASKRLKEVLEARKASSRDTPGSGNLNGPSIQALMQAIEHEIEFIVRAHEVRLEYNRHVAERVALDNEIKRLKEESEVLKKKNMSDSSVTMSPSARNSRICALENMKATLSSTIVSMGSQLSEAAERERVLSGKGRWNQVRSLADAKNLINYLFDLASTSRCQLRDREVDCREKDSVIRELREKIVSLSSLVKKLEVEVAEMNQKEKFQFNYDKKFSSNKYYVDNATSFGGNISSTDEDGRPYRLRKEARKSQIYSAGYSEDLLEDMDTSESEHSGMSGIDDSDDDWVESGKRFARKRVHKTGTRPVAYPTLDEGQDSGSSHSETSNADPVTCCSCSRYSSCKTKKCECRDGGRICGTSCGCSHSKCANREVDHTTSEAVESDKNVALVSHGAMLLENALSEKPNTNGDDQPRRALKDIGNKVVNSNAPRPPPRKQWRKSAIQIVPTVVPPAQTETRVTASTQDAPQPDIPLKVSQALRSPQVYSNVLVERNSGPADEPVDNKEARANVPRSPVRGLRGKENDQVPE
ncbi:Kinesin-like protein FLA10 [Acorus gramineus]|uniref:Kinesin-like protein FLA10 n=1 Tax=Acorus gramineus TaxID=55184 RepID=A0AAV9BG91_ACOGR|nr:Kinesin-like protein FLA10 [Acorus gramineus]